MKQTRNAAVAFFLALLLTACSVGPGTASTGSQGATPFLTEQPTLTQTITITPTITPTMTNTPTISPPPDLELMDVKIYPETYNIIGQTYTLLGRVRNNTNMIMIFREEDLIFKFVFEVWEFDSLGKPSYRHAKYSEEIKLGTDMGRKMNCILYPGDEGVLFYNTRSVSKVYILHEDRDKYEGSLGFWYTYESFYHTQPDLPLYYHPIAENLTYEKKDGELAVDFDVSIHKLLREGVYGSSIYSWIILYDENGNNINILKKRLNEMSGLVYGGTFHFHSSTAASDYSQEYMRPAVEMTSEMIERTDHIDVFIEFEEGSTCRGSST